MPCNPNDVACALHELTATLDGPNWSNFWLSLAGTVIGAAIAGAVAYLIFRGERRERYTQRFVAAASRVVDETTALLTARNAELMTAVEDDAKLKAFVARYGASESDTLLRGLPLIGLVTMAIAVARHDDRRVMKAANDAMFKAVEQVKHLDDDLLLMILWVIPTYVAGGVSADAATEKLASVKPRPRRPLPARAAESAADGAEAP